MKPIDDCRLMIADWGKVVAVIALALVAVGCKGKAGAGGPPGGFAVNVRTVIAARQPIEERVSLVATVAANESVDVKSEIEGTVAQVNFDEGQPVTEGQLLVKLDTRKLEASVANAEASFDLAKTNRERAEAMLENRTISRQEFDQSVANFESGRAMLDLVKQQLKDASIHAPFSGIAGARHVSPGQVIGKEMVLTTLVDVEPVKLEFRAPERLIGELRRGQTIAFRVAAYPGEEFHGEVFFIDPQVEIDTRTVLVKALEPNADGKLHPGMFGNLDLILHVNPDAVVVPESAVVSDGDHTYVFLADASNVTQQVEVQLGTRLAGLVEVTRGLQGGETVIVEGIQKVQPGVPVVAQPVDAAKGTEAPATASAE